LRDVMDSPTKLRQEWAKSNALQQIENLYDDIWVYGTEKFWDPLQGLEVTDALREKMTWLGFLRRAQAATQVTMNRPKQSYLLVTGGGGGDGARLMGQVLSAYESGGEKLPHALLVLGPLMPSDQRGQIFARAGAVESVDVIEFDNNMEDLIEGAAGIVGMCGYNTFCEVLSFNKPALIVPRTYPREEQFIRATRAGELGLLQVMLPDDADDAQLLAGALAGLSNRPLPAKSGGDAMLQGLDSINDFVSNWAGNRPTADLYARSGVI